MLKKLSVFLALFSLILSLFVGIDRFAHQRSSRFSPQKIISQHPSSSEWDLPPLSQEEQARLRSILNQKFTYYSKGSQSYVFISEDKQHILKFLKQNKLSPKSWFSAIPLSFNPYYLESVAKEKKRQATFLACKTAFLELKKETGVIYVHLNPTRDLNRELLIFDKHGKSHLIDLNRTNFYVQKKAELIYSRITKLMDENRVEEAKGIISSVFSLLQTLGKKGVVDNDPIVRKNFGLINDIAVQIDIGKLRIDPNRQGTSAYVRDVPNIMHSFKNWIEKSYPTLSKHFEAKISISSQDQQPVAPPAERERTILEQSAEPIDRVDLPSASPLDENYGDISLNHPASMTHNQFESPFLQ